MTDQDAIELLRRAIESKIGCKIRTPKDFDLLRSRIFEDCHIMVSTSTLKRIWGYNDYKGKQRVSSLEPLAKFIGFRNWESFVLTTENEEENQKQKTYLDEPTQNGKKKHGVLYPILVAITALICGAACYHLWTGSTASPTKESNQVSSTSIHRILRKGQDCFKTINDYLTLFDIEDSDTAYFRPLPNHKYVYVWGPEYHHPVWHNEGNPSKLMPTITEYWIPLIGEKDFQSEEYVKLANEKLYYERLQCDELRITFMKNLVEDFYVFIGIYRLDRNLSTKEKCVWTRISDECDLSRLDQIEELRK